MSARKRKTKPAGAAREARPAARTERAELAPVRTFTPASLWLLCLSLAAATLVAYYPAWRGGLLWDDDGHLTAAALRSLHGLWRIWFEVGATQQYYPVVHSTFWIEHRLWGDATLGYHLVNILLHAASACLVAVILRRLAVPGAVLAAVIFALHPIQVESVAWITELKNTLSGVCYLGAALAYLGFDERRDGRRYALALTLFVVALLSKTVTASLPAGLLIVFWWQRGRLDWRRDVVPLVPFVILGAAGGLLTAWVEHAFIGAHGADFQITPIARVLIAGRALWFYLATLVWPANLMFTYPRWQVDPGAWWQYLYPAGAVAALVVLALRRSVTRAPLAAMLFFAVTLSPALGFINVYPFRYSFVADHFSYLANISIIALASAGIVTLMNRLSRPTTATTAVAMVAIGLPLAGLTWRQSGQYVDGETLYRATLARNPTCWFAHNNLATILLTRGPAGVKEGVVHAREAVRLDPHNPEAEYNLALGLEMQGDLYPAASQYATLLADLQKIATPDARLPLVYRSLGRTLTAVGRPDEAIATYRDAIQRGTATAEIHADLGMTLAQRGQIASAIPEFDAALRLNPSAANVHNNLGLALAQQGRAREAADQLREALRLNPTLLDVHFNLGLTLEAIGDFQHAAAEYRAALGAHPDDAQARAALTRVLAKIKSENHGGH